MRSARSGTDTGAFDENLNSIVASCSRVMNSSGPNVDTERPFTTPVSFAHATASVYHSPAGTSTKPLAAAGAVSLGLMEDGDLYIGAFGGAKIPPDFAPGAPLENDPRCGSGAACALKRKNSGSVAVTEAADGEALAQAVRLAVALDLPVVFLVNCTEASADGLSGRFMAMDIECITADGRSVMALMPALRHAVDKAREGDGPTLIECVCDRMPEDEEMPTDPLERLDSVLIYEGYETPEGLI